MGLASWAGSWELESDSGSCPATASAPLTLHSFWHWPCGCWMRVCPDLFLLNNKIFLLYKFFTGNWNCLTIKGCLWIPKTNQPKKKKKEKHFAACFLFLMATIDLAHSISLDLAGKGLGWIKRFSFQLFHGISAPFVRLFLLAGSFLWRFSAVFPISIASHCHGQLPGE